MFKRFKEKTPRKNKRIGRLATVIATVTGSILTAGVVTAPIGITILTITTALSTGVAMYNGYQTEKDSEIEN